VVGGRGRGGVAGLHAALDGGTEAARPVIGTVSVVDFFNDVRRGRGRPGSLGAAFPPLEFDSIQAVRKITTPQRFNSSSRFQLGTTLGCVISVLSHEDVCTCGWAQAPRTTGAGRAPNPNPGKPPPPLQRQLLHASAWRHPRAAGCRRAVLRFKMAPGAAARSASPGRTSRLRALCCELPACRPRLQPQPGTPTNSSTRPLPRPRRPPAFARCADHSSLRPKGPPPRGGDLASRAAAPPPGAKGRCAGGAR
jgi:hypothetical protein